MSKFTEALKTFEEALLIMQNANNFEDMKLDNDTVSEFHYLARRCEDYLECYRQLMSDE